MKASSIVTTLIVIIVVLGVAYYFFMMPQGVMAPTGSTTDTSLAGSDNIPNDTPDTDTSATPAANPLVLTANSATLGSYLAATTNGMTLYTFTSDKSGVSNCTGSCAVNWPPYTIAPGTTLAGGADMHGTFGTITRTDGSTQLTYNGSPLYFYIKDKKSGDTIGQGVSGAWYVIKP